MARENFEQKLQALQDEVLILGSIVENALLESVDILKQQDIERAERLVAEDKNINKKRFDIEGDTLNLIATQQPMAGDLRTLAAVLEIITELERMGDYAKGIANLTLKMEGKPIPKPLIDIPDMAQKAQSMLHRALDAFVRRDVELARSIPTEDDEVDDLYNNVYRAIIKMITDNPQVMDEATCLLWAAHNLERTADRVINICERVIFTVTGEMIELS